MHVYIYIHKVYKMCLKYIGDHSLYIELMANSDSHYSDQKFKYLINYQLITYIINYPIKNLKMTII